MNDAGGDAGGDGWDCHIHVFDAAAATHAGHYRPVERPLAQIEALAAAHGIGHLVLVQPSVYGSDNRVLLRALAAGRGRHRGVVVLADDVTDDELQAMHAAGVRGVRFNLVSPVGERTVPATRFAALASRIRPLGWHVQWYARTDQLQTIAALHTGSGLTCVLDHLGGFGTGVTSDDAAWTAVQGLAAQGAWLKLSGWYRLGATAPYAALLPPLRRLAAQFGPRMVWGSDWPHTMFAADALPPYASTWQPVADALGAQAAAALRRGQPAIYG